MNRNRPRVANSGRRAGEGEESGIHPTPQFGQSQVGAPVGNDIVSPRARQGPEVRKNFD